MRLPPDATAWPHGVAAYGEHRRRRARIPQQWDPDDLFRGNHDSAPEGNRG